MLGLFEKLLSPEAIKKPANLLRVTRIKLLAELMACGNFAEIEESFFPSETIKTKLLDELLATGWTYEYRAPYEYHPQIGKPWTRTSPGRYWIRPA